MKASLCATVIIGLVCAVLPGAHALRYTVHSTPLNFYQAYHQCISNGGYLVAIETAAQNAAVVKAIKKAGGAGPWWTSGTDYGLEGAWMWLSRHHCHRRPLVSATTQEDCLSIDATGLWKDGGCFAAYPYICEYNGH
uniref:C-type lectin domain-containing protein n=1 Tax=Anopheles stephensi TaxID=30069 RepID=A0A182Y9N7_ANOST